MSELLRVIKKRLAIRKLLPYLPIAPRPTNVTTYYLAGSSTPISINIPQGTDFIRIKAYYSSSTLYAQAIINFGENFILPTVSGASIENAIITSNDYIMTNNAKVLFIALLNQGYVSVEYYQGYSNVAEIDKQDK